MIKKLTYKSHYRGTKEGDLILSSFAKRMLMHCSDDEIALYEILLDHMDIEIHEWVMSAERAPAHLRPIILKIINFHKFTKLHECNN